MSDQSGVILSKALTNTVTKKFNPSLNIKYRVSGILKSMKIYLYDLSEPKNEFK
jgi:hypothetical protein